MEDIVRCDLVHKDECSAIRGTVRCSDVEDVCIILSVKFLLVNLAKLELGLALVELWFSLVKSFSEIKGKNKTEFIDSMELLYGKFVLVRFGEWVE